jgi:L-ascorbate metabolism protein UlaG (beta-lactamase superfamily)
MRVEWFGQSAFHLSGPEASVAIDPFGDLSALTGRGVQFEYPPITGVEAQLVLVTHEHADHNGVEAIGASPAILRSTAGRLLSPLGEVTAIASEHDERAGTERGPNTIFVFELDGLRVCHLGDLGQVTLREEQADAIGEIDLLFVPVGGGPTIGAEQAATIVARLGPRWVVPMHYRTHRLGFLEPVDAFLERSSEVERLPGASFEIDELRQVEGPLVVLPAAP